MGELKYDYSDQEMIWNHSDLLNIDLEQMEYDKNFAVEEAYVSIFDEEEPVYHSMMNFQEDDEDALYAEEPEEPDEYRPDIETNSEDDEEDPFGNRDSYRDTNLDNVYYLI